MKKMILFGCFTFALLGVCGSVKANDIVDFLNAWRNMQRDYEQRYDRWDDYRHRGQPAPQPAPDPNPNQIVGTLHSLSSEMLPYVTAIANAVAAVDDRELKQHAETAEAELSELAQSARDHDREHAAQHHERFDASWQQVVFRLQNYKTSSRLNEYIAIVTEKDRRMHMLLNRGYRPGFERNRIESLAQQLDNQVEVIVQKLQRQKTAWEQRALSFQAQRVARHADEFAELAQASTSHDLLVQEFRQFDDNWHALTERLRDYGPRDLNLHSEIAAVRETDRQLHQVLLVEAPVISDRRSTNAVLQRAEDTAEELVDELREMMWRERIFGNRRVIGYLMRLEDEIDNFAELPERDQTDSRWKVVADAWVSYEAAQKDLPAEKLSVSVQSLQNSLRQDMDYLSRRFEAKPGRDWRYGGR